MPRLLSLLAVPALVLLGACGSGDEPALSGAGEDRTIEIEMRDIAFAPTAVDVRAGEKVRFVFTNTGQLTHDAFIGDATAQEEHGTEVRSSSGVHDHGTTSNAVTVEPGKKRQLVYTFDGPGQLLIGCHQPGHYIGGMKATLNIA